MVVTRVGGTWGNEMLVEGHKPPVITWTCSTNNSSMVTRVNSTVFYWNLLRVDLTGSYHTNKTDNNMKWWLSFLFYFFNFMVFFPLSFTLLVIPSPLQSPHGCPCPCVLFLFAQPLHPLAFPPLSCHPAYFDCGYLFTAIHIPYHYTVHLKYLWFSLSVTP